MKTCRHGNAGYCLACDAQRTNESMDDASAAQAVVACRNTLDDERRTQKSLAADAGINQSLMSKIERGEVRLTVGRYLKLLRVMGVLTLEVRIPDGEVRIDGRKLTPREFVNERTSRGKPYLEPLKNGTVVYLPQSPRP